MDVFRSTAVGTQAKVSRTKRNAASASGGCRVRGWRIQTLAWGRFLVSIERGIRHVRFRPVRTPEPPMRHEPVAIVDSSGRIVRPRD
jgi:hypothetical protein